MPRIYCCQHDVAWEDARGTCGRVGRLLAGAGLERGALVLLPEMFATGFTMNLACAAEGVVRDFLSQQAMLHGVWMQGGVTQVGADGKGRNLSLTFDPAGACVAEYAKMHPFSFGAETKTYVAGAAVRTFAWDGLTVAPFVCYDLRFPEVFRTATVRGANVMTVIANWPRDREMHWRTLLAARAIENQAYVAAVNRVGADPKAVYGGGSLIIDPRGNVLADAGAEERVISAEIGLTELAAWRQHFPALKDMRRDYHDALANPRKGDA